MTLEEKKKETLIYDQELLFGKFVLELGAA